MKKNDQGFTLAELLIVVAIIAILVAVAIPIFTPQVERSRESTDMANVRAAYAELMAAAIDQDDSATYNGQHIKNNNMYTVKVELKQKPGWVTDPKAIEIAGHNYANGGMVNQPGSICTITFNAEDGRVLFDWGGPALSSE